MQHLVHKTFQILLFLVIIITIIMLVITIPPIPQTDLERVLQSP